MKKRLRQIVFNPKVKKQTRNLPRPEQEWLSGDKPTMTGIREQFRLSNDVRDAYQGSLYGSIFASGDTTGDHGYLDYRADPHHVHVQMIEVPKEHQHKGVGRALVDHLKKEFPHHKIKWGVRTPAGQGFIRKYYHQEMSKSNLLSYVANAKQDMANRMALGDLKGVNRRAWGITRANDRIFTGTIPPKGQDHKANVRLIRARNREAKKNKAVAESNWMYHGTPHNVDRFRPDREAGPIDRAIGTHFAADPEVSRKFSHDLYADMGQKWRKLRGDDEKVSGVVWKTKAPPRSQLLRIHQKHYRWSKPEPRFDPVLNKTVKRSHGAYESDQAAIGAHVLGTVFSRPENKDLFTKWAKYARNIDAPLADKLHATLMSGKAPKEKEFGTAQSNRPGFRSYMANFDATLVMEPEKDFRKTVVNRYLDIMRQKGIRGLVYRNTSPTEMEKVRSPKTYVIFDPETLALQKEALEEARYIKHKYSQKQEGTEMKRLRDIVEQGYPEWYDTSALDRAKAEYAAAEDRYRNYGRPSMQKGLAIGALAAYGAGRLFWKHILQPMFGNPPKKPPQERFKFRHVKYADIRRNYR